MRSAGRRGKGRAGAKRKAKVHYPGRRAYDGMLTHYEKRSSKLASEADHDTMTYTGAYHRGQAYAYRHSREMAKGRRL